MIRRNTKTQARSMQVGDISAQLIRSKRKTLSIEIQPNGVIIRAPKWASRREIENFIIRKESWIKKHQQKIQARQSQVENLEPLTDEELCRLTEQAKKSIPSRVEYYAKIIGVDYGRITIRHQRTRWGSCSSKGNLNFNCLLMMFPGEVIDSVVVHELCHRKQMNHSAAFYNEVERAFPQYWECHRWLHEHGSLQLARLR